MAKKNLSRSVLEGGRRPYNKYERRHSSKDERVAVRTFTNKAKLADPDDLAPPAKRQAVRKEFTDKLGPVYRWLDKQCGKNWGKVFSELCENYDTSTTLGRHIVYQHILPEVQGSGVATFGIGPDRYLIDRQGRLQKNRAYARWTKRGRLAPKPGLADAKFKKAFAGRHVVSHGSHYYWGEPVLVEYRHYAKDRQPSPDHKGPDGRPTHWISGYRQGPRLSADELKLWAQLSDDQKRQVLRDKAKS